MSEVVLEQVKQMAEKLSRPDKARLVEWLGAALTDETPMRAPAPRLRSLYGLCADLGPGPSDDDISQMCREMQTNIPRDGKIRLSGVATIW